jgi:hypothetical protein
MGCLHLARVTILPYIAGLRNSVVSLLRLWTWCRFLGFSRQSVERFLGNSKFVHNRSSSGFVTCGTVKNGLASGGLARFRE